MTVDEIALHVSQTEAFIEVNPSWAAFSRTVRIPDGAGGFRESGSEVINAQRVRVFGLRAPLVRLTNDGEQVVVTKGIEAFPGADIAVGDSFLDADGTRYEVITVMRDPAWRVYAEASSRG